MDFPTVEDVRDKYSIIEDDCARVEDRIDFLTDQITRDQEKVSQAEQRRNDRDSVGKTNQRLWRRRQDLRREKAALKHLRGLRDALKRRIETADRELKDSELTIAHLSPVEKRRLFEELHEKVELPR